MTKYKKLFSPIRIGNLELKNRGVMPPMVTNYGNSDGTVSDRLIDYLEARAKGGVGLIIVEAAIVDINSKSYTGNLRIDSDKSIPSFKKLVERVHAAGAKIGIQVGHFGRQTNYFRNKTVAVAPSAIPCPITNSPTRALSTNEVKEMVQKYAQGIKHAKDAGFDLVEIHGSHGYLINQFLSPWTNKRTDEYGGSAEKRERFPLEILAESRKLVGEDYPLTYRISSEEFTSEGLTIDDTSQFCKKLVDNGIDAISVSGGNYAVMHIISGCEDESGFYIDQAEAIRGAVDERVPIIVANRIRKPELAESILKEGKADMIALGRPLICDPEYFEKARTGRDLEIRHCTSCLYCIDGLFDDGCVKCLYNPTVGREQEFELTKKTEKPKKLVVVGGGPGGMEAAYTAALRGHKVVLFEKNDYLGGNVVPGDKPPFKEIGYVTEYLSYMLDKTNIDVRLNTEADLENILAETPDIVFVASGSKPIRPKIPGADSDQVVLAEDVLMDRVIPKKNVIVIGGGSVGVETAEYLSEKGYKVAIIEMADEILADVTVSPKRALLQRVEENGICVYTSERVLEIKNKTIVTNKQVFSDIDSVVMAVGYQRTDDLSMKLAEEGVPVNIIGDAIQARRINDAVNEAFSLAYSL